MKTLYVNIPNREYIITIGSGVIRQLPDLLRNRKAFVVTDSNVLRLYGNILPELLADREYRIAEVSAGERSKNINEAAKLWSDMASYGLTRGDTIVALGGGVIGDLAGFVASAYMRGVSYIQIPTTLVSQIDSSVGGKTAVNISEGKNLVGTFYQPETVLLDIDFLKTLPERELKAGLAEADRKSVV